MTSTRPDLAIVGAGPAGIAAAVAATHEGLSVTLFDMGTRPGGQIWRHGPGHRPTRAARRWLAALAESGAAFVPRASVVSIDRDGCSILVEREQAGGAPARGIHIRPGALLLATGARERFLPFPGWTLPGVVGVGGAQALLKNGGMVVGERAVVAGSGPLLLPVAASLARAGAEVIAVAEQAPRRRIAAFARQLWRTPAKIVQAAGYRWGFRRARYRTGTWVERAEGNGRLESVTLTNGRRRWSEPCDLLACAYGLVPEERLATLAGCEGDGGGITVSSSQKTSVPWIYAAGESTGIGGVELAVLEGEIAGLAIAGKEREAGKRFAARDRARDFARRLERAFTLRDEVRTLAEPDTIVCRCEDVPLRALDPDWTARQAKLYTRLGMGPCQGRVCGPAVETIFGWPADRVRPPAFPAAVSALVDQTPTPTADHS